MQNIYQYSLLFFFFLLPFIYFPGVYNPFEFPKFILTVSFVQLLLILRVIIFFTQPTPLPKNNSTIFLLLFLLFLFLANIAGMDPMTSFMGGMYRHQGFLFFFSVIVLFFLINTLAPLEKKSLYKNLAKVAFFQFILITAVAVFHLIQFSLFENYTIPLFKDRIVTTFGNPHFLAGYVLMLLPLAITGLASFNAISQKTTYIVGILFGILTATTLYATDSKTTFLAGMCMLLFFIYHNRSFIKNTTIQKILLVVCLSLFTVMLGIIVYTARYSPWDNRLIIWGNGIQSVFAHPFLGIGQENVQLIIKQRFFVVDNAHNIFLEIAVAAGIPALLLFIGFLSVRLKKSLFPVHLSIIAFLVCASLNPVSIPQLVFFWLLLAF